MTLLRDLTGQTLIWRQPHLGGSEFQLLYDTAPLGILLFRSLWGSLATADLAEGSWTFKRVGFFRTRITIRATGSDHDLATFQPNTWSSGGSLELSSQRLLRITTNFWNSRFEVLDATDCSVLRYRTQDFLKLRGEVDLLAPGASLPELPWVVMFGWYLIVLLNQDAAAAGAVAAI